ncbi:MAG: hypothetical protein SNJ57_11560 [Cyanobacteriota bacterium]
MNPFRWLNARLPKERILSPKGVQTAQKQRSQISWRSPANRPLQPLFLRLALFLLTLPAVGALFWLGTGWLNQRVLGQSYRLPSQIILPNPQQVELTLRLTVVSIDVEIDQSEGTSEVDVQVRGSTLQSLEFEYPLTDYATVERAIAQELNLPPDQVRQLMRYRIE